MKLEKHVIESLKSAVTHNVAQNLLQGDKEAAQYYIDEFSELLLNLEVEQPVICEIITHAKMKAESEVEIIRDMNKRYGLQLHVKGHAGSQIKPEVYLEQFFELLKDKK